MFLADCHTHSVCSPDSNVPMVQFLDHSLKLIFSIHEDTSSSSSSRSSCNAFL